MTPELEGKILVAIVGLETTMKAHEKMDDERHRTIMDRLNGVETDVEQTGEHQVSKLEEELKRRDAGRGDWIKLVVAAVLGFALSLASTLVALGIQR